MTSQKEDNLMDKLVSLAKRRGFVYQGSEIYGGLAGTWDYGPNGVALKNNIKNSWWKFFIDSKRNIYGLDSAILMNPEVWKASGHLESFTDPLVECEKCKRRYREDHLEKHVCPDCDGKLTQPKQFNMMFKTAIGALEDSSSSVYLRPETAGGIFTNYKNILDTFHPRLPFGIGQVGKSFRNEIAPRDFIFRVRELEIMEFEFFVREAEWETHFEELKRRMWAWFESVGLSKKNIKEEELGKDDLAHYSKRTTDFYYRYPFGFDEMGGIAYRTNHDLSAHQKQSGVDLRYFDQETGEKFIPHVVEPTFGLDRVVFATMSEAYTEEEAPVAGGGTETRIVLKLASDIAPIKVAILPLMRKPELIQKARELYDISYSSGANNRCGWNIVYDETGSIGKRYRRQDEVGTPLCVTVDYETLEDEAVTVRDRDSMKQERIAITDLSDYFTKQLG